MECFKERGHFQVSVQNLFLQLQNVGNNLSFYSKIMLVDDRLLYWQL